MKKYASLPHGRASNAGPACGLVLALSAFLLLPTTTWAAPIVFTDATAFFSVVDPNAPIVDFDGVAAGTLIPDGAPFDIVTFSYDLGGVSLEVVDDFDTVSPPNALGTNDVGVLQGGDDTQLAFAPRAAVGMFFATADELLDDDIVLTAGGTSVSLVAADRQTTLPDGTDLYFLGIVDAVSPIGGASIATLDGGFFLYNIDRIVIPEPSLATGLLTAVGFMLVAGPRRAATTIRSLGR